MVEHQKLIEIAERVEALTGPDHTLDGEILVAFHPKLAGTPRAAAPYHRYTASLDAAMSLRPEGWRAGFEESARCDESDKAYAWVWPWESSYDPDCQEGQQGNPDASHGYAATPALALTAAALRARAAMCYDQSLQHQQKSQEPA
jgi:hypothetical protein